MDPTTFQTEPVKLKLEECIRTITWHSSKGPEISLRKNNELSPGLKLKYTIKCKDNIAHLREGFIDIGIMKTIELGFVDMLSVPKQTLSVISACFKV